MDDTEDLNEKVLDITQRQKRARVLRAHRQKIERARELAKKRLAPEKNIKKRAYAQARQIVRQRFAGQRGAEYEKLGPSERMAIDRAVEKKTALIKKIALRLIPRVKRAESQRLQAFVQGQAMQNQGAPEAHKPPMNEDLNALFEQEIGDVQSSPETDKEKMDKKQAKKKSPIVQYAKFGEESDNVSPVYMAIAKKAGKSGIDIDILGEVYDRGMDAWDSDMNVSQQQYAFARVNSYINQGKTYFNEDADLHEGRAPGTPSIKRYTRPDGSTALKSLNKWGKRKDWRDTEGGLAKAREHAGVDKVTEEVEHTNENFMDGKGPGKPGDAARHGLKGKSAAELKQIRSSETASPRKKQLAHWMLNMHHNEETEIQELSATTINAYRRGMEKDVALNPKMDPKKKERRLKGFKTSTNKILGLAKVNVEEGLKDPEDNPCWKGYKPVGTKKKAGKTVPNCVPEAVEKVVGTNCRNCSWWKPGSEKPVTKEELNKNGGLKAPNKEYIAMSKRIDLGTLPGEDHNVKVKGFCEHKEINDWVTERMCCSQWDADGMIRDYKGQSPVMKEEGESIVPQTTSPGSKIRKKLEVVDRKPPHGELTKQAEIKTKIIDEEGNSQPDPKKRLIGTDSLVKAYKKDTPGQCNESLNESFNIQYAAGVGVTLTAGDLGMRTQGAFAYHPSVIEEMERRAREQEEVEEEVKSADVKAEVIPAHTKTVTDPKTGATKQVTVPGHVRRAKKNKTIIPSGSVTDGMPG